MRLRHTDATLQTPTTVPPSQATESSVPLETPHRQPSVATTTTPTRNVSQLYRRATKATSPFPPAGGLIKVAAFGLVYGAFTCLMLLEVTTLPHFGINTPSLLGPFASRLLLVKSATLFLLSLLLAFRLGWQARHGIRGAVVTLIFGLTLILGFRAALGSLWSLLTVAPISSFGLLPFQMLAFIVALGVVGGACGQVWQALGARNHRNNR